MKDWIRRHHHPGFRAADEVNRDIPEDLWVKCRKCGELLYGRELESNQMVCPKCSHHFRMRAHQRIEQLTDPGAWHEFATELRATDPLGFVSNGESYADKLSKAQKKTGMDEAMRVGMAAIDGCPVVLCVNDFSFMGASMGSVYGEKLVRAVDLAVERGLPVLTVSSSGGARMQEGMFSLMQMAKTTSAFARLGRERLSHVALLVDPCTGGVTASYCTVADVIIAEPGALIGFAGPRVIEQTTRQKLPAGFQSAEFCLRHGMIDLVVPRRELPAVIGKTLRLLATKRPALVS